MHYLRAYDTKQAICRPFVEELLIQDPLLVEALTLAQARARGLIAVATGVLMIVHCGKVRSGMELPKVETATQLSEAQDARACVIAHVLSPSVSL